MDLAPYVERIRRELARAAEAGGEEARALTERLTAPLESTIRLALLEALAAATAEITSDLAPGSVHVRLSGPDPVFVVTSPATDRLEPDEATTSPLSAVGAMALPATDKGSTSRINLRLPDEVKAAVEQAATLERISVNAWLVRAVTAALNPGASTGHRYRAPDADRRFTGWVR